MKKIKERGVIIDKIGIVGDFHLGQDEILGIKMQRKMIEENLTKMIEKYDLKKLIINGDIKESFGYNREEFREIEILLKNINKIVNLEIIKGNHDNYIEKIWDVRDEIKIKNILIHHGHVEKNAEFQIIAHEHPAISFSEMGKKYTFPIFLEFKDLLVIPAFNPLTYGTDVLTNPFLSENVKKRNLNEAKVYIIEEDLYYFHKIKDIKKLFE